MGKSRVVLRGGKAAFLLLCALLLAACAAPLVQGTPTPRGPGSGLWDAVATAAAVPAASATGAGAQASAGDTLSTAKPARTTPAATLRQPTSTPRKAAPSRTVAPARPAPTTPVPTTPVPTRPVSTTPVPAATAPTTPVSTTPAPAVTAPPRFTATPRDGLPTIREQDLPREAQTTLRLIRSGGPFPYDKDGSTFQNREGLLPGKPRGYYREYTVITPGEGDRGARRIVAGGNGELYYTDDHYNSFKRVTP